MKMCNLIREKRKVFIRRISFSQSVLSGRETLGVCENTKKRTGPARFAVKPQFSHSRFVNCAIASKILSLCISELFLLSVPFNGSFREISSRPRGESLRRLHFHIVGHVPGLQSSSVDSNFNDL